MNGKLYVNYNEISSELKDGAGFIKEYDNNGKIIFEGEYKEGKRDGKGKEYDINGKLIFEGEYLSNIKWNGKRHDINGNILYELNNGNGKIKEYNNNGDLIFDGE